LKSHLSLQDLTRLESGNETSFNEPFDLHFAIEEATHLYRKEAERRDVKFVLELQESPRTVVGDAKKIRTVVQNLTANSRMSEFLTKIRGLIGL
jgi:signal transduction histidine kinase